MVSWSTKRKLTYLITVFGTAYIVIMAVFFTLYRENPSCSDGRKNGDETGVDCGGSCGNLCPSETLAPIIHWQKIFSVNQGTYSALAYVENPNLQSEVISAPYVFHIYDDKNVLIAEKRGVTFLPKNKVFAVFESDIKITDKIPKKAVFEFVAPLNWKKNIAVIPNILVQDKYLSQEKTTPRIDALIENKSVESVSKIESVAIVYDDNKEAVGASRTMVDEIRAGGSYPIVFTWPKPFQTKEIVCESPADVMLVLDRSGSMADDGKNPPEPLTEVKKSASLFIDQLKTPVQAGLVSFANSASDPIDFALTADFEGAKSAINKVEILNDGKVQNTNLADGLLKANGEFVSARHLSEAKKVIVALTDGIATEPRKAGDEDYAQKFTATTADVIKAGGTEVYVIGLGNKVNAEFLKGIASSPTRYFGAVTSQSLNGIYKNIATDICKRAPVAVEIITRILPK